MKEFFKDILKILEESYRDIYENEDVSQYETTTVQFSDMYILCFGFLKIVDNSLKFSKQEVLNTYNRYSDIDNLEEILLKISILQSGEKIGIYNFSEYSLESFEKEDEFLYDKFIKYLKSFNKEVQFVFENFDLYSFVEFFDANNILNSFLTKLSEIQLDKSVFIDLETIYAKYEDFLLEFYKYEDSSCMMPSGLRFRNFIFPFLSEILCTDINIEDRNHLSILDPACKDGYLLFAVEKYVHEINPTCKVQLFGKEMNSEWYAIALSKMIFSNQNPSNLIKTNAPNEQFIDINPGKKFDLIISDFAFYEFLYKNNYPHLGKYVFDYFLEKGTVNSKIVMTIASDSFEQMFQTIDFLIIKDQLESIISLPLFSEFNNYILLVINKNKSKLRKDKFLLIDETENITRSDGEYGYSIFRNSVSNEILNSYKYFEEYEKSKIIDINEYLSNTSKKEYKDTLEEIFVHLLETNDKDKDVRIFDTDPDLIDVDNNNSDIEINLMNKNGSSKINNEELIINDDFEIKNIIDMVANSFEDARTLFPNDFKENFNFHNLMYEKNKGLNNFDVDVEYLGDLVDLNPFAVKNDSDTLLFFKSKRQPYSNRIKYNNEIENYSRGDFIECKVKSDKILIEYLYYFLNSNKGTDEFHYFSRGDELLFTEHLKYIRIPVPNIETQKEIINAVKKSNEFFDSVELLKNQFQNNILDYEHILDDIKEFQGDVEFSEDDYKFTKMNRNWRHLYDELLWPLAITYLSATKGGFETVEKANAYLKLFEFVAAFNSIILISAIPEDTYGEINREIWDSKDSMYFEMTFGKWSYIAKNLSEVYRHYDFITALDKNLFLEVSKKQLVDIIFKANGDRNIEAHSAITNVYEAEEVIEELDPYLYNLFEILKAYSGLKLYYVTGHYAKIDNKIQHRVIILNGPCAQPIYDDVFFNKELDGECLYLYDSKNNNLLKIKDNLMKFEAVDKYKREWALFLFNGTYRDSETGEIFAKYKCYQRKQEDKLVKIDHIRKDILT